MALQIASLTVPQVYHLPVQIVPWITAVWDDVGTRAKFSIKKKTEDLEKFSMRCLYLMQYWMDLDECTGKFYLFHEGFLSVLFVPGDV